MLIKPPIIVTARKPRPRKLTAAAKATGLTTRIVGKTEQPGDWPSPEEHQRRGDAADELFRELVRRATGKG
jgi:hypothetical protein